MAAKAFFCIALFLCSFGVNAPAYAENKHALAMFEALDRYRYDDARMHAAKSRDPLLIRYATWMAFAGSKVEHVDFKEAVTLLKLAQDWPHMNRVQIRAERAAWLGLHTGKLKKSAVEEFCDTFPPIAGIGMVSCVRAGANDSATQKKWLKDAWEKGDFTRAEEAQILDLYRKKFDVTNMRARINRLLYEGKTQAAGRLLDFFHSDERTLYEARIALRSMGRNVNGKIRAVAANYQKDPGLLFDRMRWRYKKGLDSGVFEMLLAGPDNPPYADSWWPIRNLYARKALREGQTRRAITILRKHGALNRINMAEARWMLGWAYHSFARDYRKAYETFYALHENVSTPVSLARAAYWAASAARKSNNHDIAEQWLRKAAKHTTVFYGQLAYAALHPDKPLALPKDPEPSSREKATFDKKELVQLVVTLARYQQNDAVAMFMRHMAAQAEKPETLALLANLGRAIGSDYNAVRVAKRALRKHIILLEHGWPVIALPNEMATPKELTLSISRQESEFDPRAKSHAGARGLMQLMPRTARDTARKNSMPYRLSKLWDPVYNMVLGSHYLRARLEAYDHNYVLAIASYNAGPGNVLKWLKAFGQPPASLDGRLHWMESIPFSETRNYVQRVLENMQVYRARLGQRKSNQILQDILR